MAPAPALVRRPAGSNGSLTGARVVGSRNSVHVPGPAAAGPGGEGCRRLPGRRVPGRDRNRALPLGGTLDLAIAPERRSRRRRGRIVGAVWSRAGSEGGRGLGMTPLEVGGHGCPDDAAQRVERPAAATALDDPKAGTRESRLADVERSPRARPGRVPVIEGREERRVTAGRREPLPHAGRRASAVLRPATTAADGRGRPTSRDQRRSQALWPHAHLLTTRLRVVALPAAAGIAWVGMRGQPVIRHPGRRAASGIRLAVGRSTGASPPARRRARCVPSSLVVDQRRSSFAVAFEHRLASSSSALALRFRLGASRDDEARHVPVRGALAARELLSIQLVTGPGTD